MTRKHPKTKQDRTLEQETEQLEQLLVDAAKVQIFTHSFVRNQLRHARRERIAPVTPSTPNPELAAIDYQHRDLAELQQQLGTMANTVTALQKGNRERRAAYEKLLGRK